MGKLLGWLARQSTAGAVQLIGGGLLITGVVALVGIILSIPLAEGIAAVVALAGLALLILGTVWRRKGQRLISIGGLTPTTPTPTPIAVPAVSDKKYFSREVVRIADVLSDRGTIDGKTFDDCEIHGPAVLVSMSLGAMTLDLPTFVGGSKFDDIFWLRLGGDNIVGAVPVNSVIFRRCRFERVGLVETQAGVDKLKASGLVRKVVEVPLDLPSKPDGQ